jgi:phosphoglycerate dehydrogenase-like enzyme
LLGFGAIGREVAQRLRGFNCTLLAYDPFVDTDTAAAYGVQLTSLAEVTVRSDFLSLHLPVTEQTHGMINRTFLASMKAGSCLINTARGELIDEAALVEALTAGPLAGAALDCFPVEPPAAHNPLLALPQVIVTPHAASHTDGAINAMGWGALRNCLAVLRGEPPLHPVT